jgi:hypothetical protein
MGGIMFTVKDIDEVLGRLRGHGATFHGELVQYEINDRHGRVLRERGVRRKRDQA